MTSFSLWAMRLPFPTAWEDIFGRAAPLVLEIGFGNGVFLAELAGRFPDHNILGIERAHSPMEWTEKRIQNAGLSNVRLVYGEALMALRCLFEPGILRAVHVNFSDPWHKQRHRDRRLIDMEFIRTLVSRLEEYNGHLYIATDIQNYANQIHKALLETPGIKNAHTEPWRTRRDEITIQTHYEKKARSAGRECYYFQWQRTGDSVPHPVYRIPDETMPNALIELPATLDEIAQNFPLDVFRDDNRIVNLKGIYRDQISPALLIEAFIQEPLFSQHLMITIYERQPGQYLVRMAEIGFPRATEGVRDAIKFAIHQLFKLYPNGKIINSKVRGLDSSTTQ